MPDEHRKPVDVVAGPRLSNDGVDGPTLGPVREGATEFDKKVPDRNRTEMDVYSGVRWSVFSKYSAQVIQIIVSIVMARLLAPEYFGLLGMATLVTGFVKVFRDLGFASAIVQRKKINDELLSTLFWVNLAVCALLAGVLAAISPLAAWMYHDPRVTPILAVLSVGFVLGGLTMIPCAVLTRQMAFNKLALREVAGVVMQGATAIPLACLGWGVWALVAASLAGTATELVLLNLACPFRPKFVFDGQGLKECLGFGLNVTGFSIFNYFARNADNLLIGVFLGPVALGYYSFAYKLMLLPRDTVTGVVTRVLFPAFSRMQDDDERLANAYLRACGAIAFLTFPMMAGVFLVAHPFVELVLGDKWLPAVPLIMLLAPLGAIQSIGVTSGQVLLAKGRADWYFRWGIVASILYIISFAAGIPWGIIGIAISYVCMSLVLMPVGCMIAFRLVSGLNVLRLYNHLRLSAVCTLLMAGVAGMTSAILTAVNVSPPLTMTGAVCIGVSTYALFAVRYQREQALEITTLLAVPPQIRRALGIQML